MDNIKLIQAIEDLEIPNKIGRRDLQSLLDAYQKPEFEQALSALANTGDISAPIKTEFGYHILKLLEKKETVFPSFEERKPEIEKQLRQAKADVL